jgi:hypothetical protein
MSSHLLFNLTLLLTFEIPFYVDNSLSKLYDISWQDVGNVCVCMCTCLHVFF